MTIELHILRDLAAGQATAGAVGEHLNKPEAAVSVVLARLKAEGLVDSKPRSCLTVWFLTDKGRHL